MNSQAKNLISKFLSFSIGSWISLIIALISTPVITRLLSPEEFGVYSLFIVVLNLFLQISLFGMDQSYIRFYYDLLENERIQVLRTCLLFAIIISMVIATGLIITKDISINIIFGTDDTTILFYFIAGICISVLNRYVILLIRMEQQANLFSLLQIIQKILDFLFFIILFLIHFINLPYHHISIIAYILAILSITLIGIHKNWNIWKKIIYPKTKHEERKNPNVTFRVLIGYGAPLGVTLLLTWAFQYIDRIMLKELSGFEELGIYSAAFKLISILNIIQVSFTSFWVPVSNQQFTENPENKKFFSKIFDIVFIAMITIGFSMIVFKDLFKIFFGNEFEEAIDLLPMLIFIPIMYTLSEITNVGINFMKKPKYHISISLMVCLINIIGNYILIPHLGAKGAAISTGLSYVAFFILRTYFGQKLYNFKIYSIFKLLLMSLFIIIAMIVTL